MNKYLKQSIIIHVGVFALCMLDMPEFWHRDMTLGEAPIIVDLSEVRIDEMTNLPSKAEFGDEDRKATVAEKPKKEQYSPETEPEPEVEPEKEVAPVPEAKPIEKSAPTENAEPSKITQDYLEAPVPEKKPEQKPENKPTPKEPPVPNSKPKPKPKAQAKPKPKAPTAKKVNKPKKSNIHRNALKNLLQEIDDNSNVEIGEKTQSAMIKTGTEVKNMGIEGGNSKGSYLSDLTISETDAIASLLRQNWNLDPGAIGIENMVVEIRVFLARDGSIQRIEFLDMARFKNDTSFRSVAESAQRAVIATQQAFKEVFGVKYADKYDAWKTMKLYFDPSDKGVR